MPAEKQAHLLSLFLNYADTFPYACKQSYVFKNIVMQPGGRLNINMSSYQYRDPHVKDKTVLRLCYLLHGNPHT